MRPIAIAMRRNPFARIAPSARCGEKEPSYGSESGGKRRWCVGCVKANGHTGAVSLVSQKMCEDCGEKQASYGSESGGKRR